ncbi:MAG: hypothetical protein ACHQIM_17270 [Sphingobacteriales bacterium]
MKTEKMSLKSIKNVLSRAEMKKIMAGSGGDTCGSYTPCPTINDPHHLPCCVVCAPVGQNGLVCM